MLTTAALAVPQRLFAAMLPPKPSFPVADYHVHLSNALSIEQAVTVAKERGVQIGIVEHPGPGYAINTESSRNAPIREALAWRWAMRRWLKKDCSKRGKERRKCGEPLLCPADCHFDSQKSVCLLGWPANRRHLSGNRPHDCRNPLRELWLNSRV
jgi:hypothetical protein